MNLKTAANFRLLKSKIQNLKPKINMNVAIVKYNAGNTASVRNALRRLGVEPLVSDEAEVLRAADGVIFPGVGEASTAMEYLRERRLDEVIRSLKQPVLGICLGMQLLGGFSEENETECLGIMPFRVKLFRTEKLKVPHTGWNRIGNLRGELFDAVPAGSYVYFVHGFYVGRENETIATCLYGEEFSAAVRYKNFSAVQFHPEKSGAIGGKILGNFLRIVDRSS
jgi:imidazole glycerol-phosphate synthase subunit HisH